MTQRLCVSYKVLSWYASGYLCASGVVTILGNDQLWLVGCNLINPSFVSTWLLINCLALSGHCWLSIVVVTALHLILSYSMLVILNTVQLMSWCKTHATSDLSTSPFLANPLYWLSLVATCRFSLITMPDFLSMCKV